LNTKLENILFLDVETAPKERSFELLSEAEQQLFSEKLKFFIERNNVDASEAYSRAGIYAEFGKIVCISCGYFEKGTLNFKVKSYFGHNEKELLNKFKQVVEQFFEAKKDAKLCAHNGKEFDFPFIGRRLLINKLKLPKALNLQGVKPWDVPHLDTLEMWKFGDYKHFTSLNLLAHIFDIPSPKDDISGADVAKVYWEENNLERIATYCEKDVVTLASVFNCLIGESPINPQKIKQQNPEIFN
jgi:uncharacterized protein YprB with RNaseH-like and TPR domain